MIFVFLIAVIIFKAWTAPPRPRNGKIVYHLTIPVMPVFQSRQDSDK